MIAVDWGTTGFRAYRLSPEGKVLETRQAEKGIVSVAQGQFPQVLDEQLAGWKERPVVMSGMVGSRQGWSEVPYVKCPAGLDDLAKGVKRVEWKGGEAWIVPGVTCRDAAGVPDVMRGEETQILGALPDIKVRNAMVCLPGTHSKWAVVEYGKIARFSTYMTGETFAVLKSHSLLGRMMKGGDDPAAFLDGVKRSGDAGTLLNHIFSVRTRGLFGELKDESAAAYLSGILIGHEIRSHGWERIFLIGAPELTALYEQAAFALDVQTETLDPQAAARALFALAKEAKPS